MKAKIKKGKLKAFKDVEIGSLFMDKDTLALKTKYSTDGSEDAYIIGSGEYYWGGTTDRVKRDEIIVFEIKIKL
jgi:hypothetical protein